jgi:hypothetical protein
MGFRYFDMRKVIINICTLTQIAPWNRVLLQKPSVAELLKKMTEHFMEPAGSLPLHRRPQLVPFLKQMNPVYTTQPSFSKIQINEFDKYHSGRSH